MCKAFAGRTALVTVPHLTLTRRCGDLRRPDFRRGGIPMIISSDDPVSKGAQRFEVSTGAGIGSMAISIAR